jgi:hypothetical protein
MFTSCFRYPGVRTGSTAGIRDSEREVAIIVLRTAVVPQDQNMVVTKECLKKLEGRVTYCFHGKTLYSCVDKSCWTAEVSILCPQIKQTAPSICLFWRLSVKTTFCLSFLNIFIFFGTIL